MHYIFVLKKKKEWDYIFILLLCALSLYLIPTCHPTATKRGSTIVALVFWNYAVGDFSPQLGTNHYSQKILVKSFCSRVRLPSSNAIRDIALLRNLNKIA